MQFARMICTVTACAATVQNLFAGILEFDFIDVNDEQVLQDHIKPNAGLIWLETPSNPLLKVTDIKKVVTIAKKKGIKVAVDNTFATPVCQQPLAWRRPGDAFLHQIFRRPQRPDGRRFDHS